MKMVKGEPVFAFMNESMCAEMDELLKGEHGATLMTYGFECGDSAVEGYRAGLIEGAFKLAGVVGLCLLAYSFGKKAVEKEQKKAENAEPVVEGSTETVE